MITSNTRFRQSLEIGRQQRLAQDVARLQAQISDGKRILAPSDDPVGAGRARRGRDAVPQRERVRELLVGLTEVRLLEPRTADPGLYERLGVDEPSKPGSTGLLVRVQDAKSDPLAELVVGRRRVRDEITFAAMAERYERLFARLGSAPKLRKEVAGACR